MKKVLNKIAQKKNNNMRAEYNFKGGIRGKHYKAMQAGYTVTIHKADGKTIVKDMTPKRNSFLYSYVVEHDEGRAPNPSGGCCTLANCMCQKKGGKRRNIVELAEVNDWIVGTGGAGKKSAGHGKLIYAMRVDEKLTLAQYYKDKRFKGRKGNTNSSRTDTYALISQHYFYFGRNAIDIDTIPKQYLNHSLEKRFRGFRRDFRPEFIKNLTQWLERYYELGVHGEPCVDEGKGCTHIRRRTKGKCYT
ncbi:MAG: hypothetical protein A2167_03920 [Planctomycetes bacterium RBG_13_46_10]|nr:MAG: hypothetical protein A2167_03920 [Planctomycetes bacterium RBG_13_46_10]